MSAADELTAALAEECARHTVEAFARYNAESSSAADIKGWPASVEVGRQGGVQAVPVQPLDLRRQHAPRGQLGELPHRKEGHRIGLVAHQGCAAGELAHEEELVDVMHARRVRM